MVQYLYMTSESHETPAPQRHEVVAGLTTLHAAEAANPAEATIEARQSAPAMEALRAYEQFHTANIDTKTAENPIEGKFRRLEFSFNLAKMYAEAGFLAEARAQIEELLVVAQDAQSENPAFGDLYWEMSDYINPPEGENGEPAGQE